MVLAALLLTGASSASLPAAAAEVLPGPIPAEVLRVLDGDTLAVRARIWLGQEVAVHVRLAGIDAPEIKGRCKQERALAQRAREALARRAAIGATVRLVDVRTDKYGGRVIARVLDSSGADLGASQIRQGLARAYAGHARQPWCGARAAAR